MRTALFVAALTVTTVLAVAGRADAQAADPSPATPGHEFTACGVPPCQPGVPSAAAGGESGSGPGALRTAPTDSPVATGAGGGSGSKGTGNTK